MVKGNEDGKGNEFGWPNVTRHIIIFYCCN